MNTSGKVLFYTFRQYLAQMFKDAILILLCIAPILCGVFFKYGIPIVQSLLMKYLGIGEILTPYYLLFDLVLAVLTPLMYCFASAYLILGEIDEGISRYLAVTPLGKKGYLVSRLVLPAAIAFIISIAALTAFSLTNISVIMKLELSLLTAVMGFIEALLIVSISGNRVEGMAVSKLSGLLILGMPVPFFIAGRVQYLLFFLPSFWISKFALEKNPMFFFLTIVTSAGWILILYRRFLRKIH